MNSRTEANKRYYANHRKEILEKQRERYHTDEEYREKKKAAMLEYAKKNPEAIKKWKEENRDRIRAYRRNYYVKNSEKAKEASRKWKSEHRDEYNAYLREYNRTVGREKKIKAWNPTLEEKNAIAGEMGMSYGEFSAKWETGEIDKWEAKKISNGLKRIQNARVYWAKKRREKEKCERINAEQERKERMKHLHFLFEKF